MTEIEALEQRVKKLATITNIILIAIAICCLGIFVTSILFLLDIIDTLLFEVLLYTFVGLEFAADIPCTVLQIKRVRLKKKVKDLREWGETEE